MKSIFLVLVAVSIGISTAVSNINFDAFKRCAALIYQREYALDDNIFTAQLNIAVKCNNTNQARFHANYCSRNENSTYCKVAEAYQTDLYKIKFIDCKDTIDSSAECSTTCRNALKTFRNNLGCCINTINNFTGSSYEYLREGLTYYLWSSCGVEPITGTCTGLLPFTLPTNPQQTCSYGQELTRQLDLLCSPSNLHTLLGRTDGCESFMQFVMGVCSLDANGNFCLATNSRAADYTSFIMPLLISNCTFTVATAQNYTTLSLFADQSLFNTCNVEAPPLTCELPIASGSLLLKAFIYMLLLLLVVYIMDLF